MHRSTALALTASLLLATPPALAARATTPAAPTTVRRGDARPAVAATPAAAAMRRSDALPAEAILAPLPAQVSAGDTLTLRWSVPDGVEEMEILLSADGGRHFAIRVSPELDPRAGAYRWVVPAIAAGEARLRVRVGRGAEEREGPPTSAFRIVVAARPAAVEGAALAERAAPGRPAAPGGPPAPGAIRASGAPGPLVGPAPRLVHEPGWWSGLDWGGRAADDALRVPGAQYRAAAVAQAAESADDGALAPPPASAETRAARVLPGPPRAARRVASAPAFVPLRN
jgi:hypothetical protein